jgi:hypothetical protein
MEIIEFKLNDELQQQAIDFGEYIGDYIVEINEEESIIKYTYENEEYEVEYDTKEVERYFNDGIWIRL